MYFVVIRWSRIPYYVLGSISFAVSQPQLQLITLCKQCYIKTGRQFTEIETFSFLQKSATFMSIFYVGCYDFNVFLAYCNFVVFSFLFPPFFLPFYGNNWLKFRQVLSQCLNFPNDFTALDLLQPWDFVLGSLEGSTNV